MTTIMLLGDLPDTLRSALEPAGLQATTERSDVRLAALQLSLDATPAEWAQLTDLANSGVSVLVLAHDDTQATKARTLRAAYVLTGTGTQESLVPLLEMFSQIDARLRDTLSASTPTVPEVPVPTVSTRDLMNRIIDVTPNPVVACDTRGRVLVFNRAAEAALFYDADWARQHMHVSQIYAEAGQAKRVLAAIRESQIGMVENLEIRLRARTGEQIPVLLAASEVLDADGKPIASVGVFQDLREKISLRTRLEDTTRQLIHSEQRMNSLNVASASTHELNQPLTVVMGSLELLSSRDDLPAGVSPRLQRAYVQLQRMADIVRELSHAPHRETRPPFSQQI